MMDLGIQETQSCTGADGLFYETARCISFTLDQHEQNPETAGLSTTQALH